MQRKISEGSESWPVSRLLFTPDTGQSLAVLLRLSLVGRSLAAILQTGRYAEHRGLWCLNLWAQHCPCRSR